MTLNPQISGLLAAMSNAPAIDFSTITPEILRDIMDIAVPVGNPPEVACVMDISLPLAEGEIPGRLYIPMDSGTEKPPLTVYFHGGGWVVGTLDTHDATCRAIAAASGSAILSVGYRLAPEHPFPTPLDDCVAAVRYAAEKGSEWGVNAARLAVAGDSAGANLAAATAIRLRDENGPKLRHQLLLYPVTDRDFSRPSYQNNGGGGYFLTTQMMQYFWDCYLPQGQSDDGLARLVTAKNLSNLPSTTLIVAEYDPLADEGLAFAEQLKQAGNDVSYSNASGMIHGFISLFSMISDAQIWIERAGARLRNALA